MIPSRFAAAIVVVMACGCSGLSPAMRLARDNGVTCKHCNCLMPADADPAAQCTVCHCGFHNHQCLTGQRASQCLLRPRAH